MDKLTCQALTTLMDMQEQTAQGPALTLYIPLHGSSAPPHISQDQLTIKNSIHEAIDRAKQLPDHATVVQTLRDQLSVLQASPSMWADKPCGMLICARGKRVHTFRLPVDTEAYIAVDSVFHLTPVIGLLTDDLPFYVLTVAQQRPVVFAGDMYGLTPLDITLPVSIDEALNIDESNQGSEQSLSAGGPSAFNGRGGARDPHEEDRLRYFRLIDHILLQKLNTKHPLILAGVDAEVAIYRHLSKYPTIIDTTIHGSHSGAKAEELSEAAVRIMHDEVIVPRHLAAIRSFQQAKGSGQPAADTADHLQQASHEGRIATLILGMNRLTTDTVNDSMQPRNCLTFSANNEEAMNDVAMHAYNTRSKVLLVNQEAMPDQTPMAAILRY